MDFGRILTQIFNMILRRLLNKGINMGVSKGSEMLARRGKGGGDPAANAALTEDAQAAAKRARKAQQLARRLGR